MQNWVLKFKAALRQQKNKRRLVSHSDISRSMKRRSLRLCRFFKLTSSSSYLILSASIFFEIILNAVQKNKKSIYFVGSPCARSNPFPTINKFIGIFLLDMVKLNIIKKYFFCSKVINRSFAVCKQPFRFAFAAYSFAGNDCRF